MRINGNAKRISYSGLKLCDDSQKTGSQVIFDAVIGPLVFLARLDHWYGMKTMAVVNMLIVRTEIWNVQGKIRPHLESDSQRGDSGQKERQETVKSIKLWIIERREHQLHGIWAEGIPPPSGQPWGKGGREGVNDTWSSPSSVMATVEVCQDRREGDRWRQLRGQRPAEKEGFDLEHLPTAYTNKRAIMGAQWEEWEEERSHHGKYLTLWVKGQLAGHHSETNNNINLWWVGNGLSRQSAYDHIMSTVHSEHMWQNVLRTFHQLTCLLQIEILYLSLKILWMKYTEFN